MNMAMQAAVQHSVATAAGLQEQDCKEAIRNNSECIVDRSVINLIIIQSALLRTFTYTTFLDYHMMVKYVRWECREESQMHGPGALVLGLSSCLLALQTPICMQGLSAFLLHS